MKNKFIKAVDEMNTVVLQDIGAVIKVGKKYSFNHFLKFNDGRFSKYIQNNDDLSKEEADNKVKLLNTEEELLMPSSLKKSHSFIGMIGICCVTHPESIRCKSVLDDKVGIYQIHNPMSAMTIRKNIDNINANSMRKLWESYNEEGI